LAGAGGLRTCCGCPYGATDTADWFFEHCAAEAPAGAALDFSPHDERVRLPVTTSGADSCVAYLGASSSLRGAAGIEGDVGANVVFRYVDGVLSSEPFWNPRTGAFPCGAIVAGVNDDPSDSCSGVHERLHVGTADCALPAP
jgi:hypothetical protein